MINLEKYDITELQYNFLVALAKGNAFQYLADNGHKFSHSELLRIAKELVAEIDYCVEGKREKPDVLSAVEYIIQDWVYEAELQDELLDIIEEEVRKSK